MASTWSYEDQYLRECTLEDFVQNDDSEPPPSPELPSSQPRERIASDAMVTFFEAPIAVDLDHAGWTHILSFSHRNNTNPKLYQRHPYISNPTRDRECTLEDFVQNDDSEPPPSPELPSSQPLERIASDAMVTFFEAPIAVDLDHADWTHILSFSHRNNTNPKLYQRHPYISNPTYDSQDAAEPLYNPQRTNSSKFDDYETNATEQASFVLKERSLRKSSSAGPSPPFSAINNRSPPITSSLSGYNQRQPGSSQSTERTSVVQELFDQQKAASKQPKELSRTGKRANVVGAAHSLPGESNTYQSQVHRNSTGSTSQQTLYSNPPPGQPINVQSQIYGFPGPTVPDSSGVAQSVWCYRSQGLIKHGQNEIVILIQVKPREELFPDIVLRVFIAILSLTKQ
ncbi:predicted protein, partial [Nematostella vectensis]